MKTVYIFVPYPIPLATYRSRVTSSAMFHLRMGHIPYHSRTQTTYSANNDFTVRSWAYTPLLGIRLELPFADISVVRDGEVRTGQDCLDRGLNGPVRSWSTERPRQDWSIKDRMTSPSARPGRSLVWVWTGALTNWGANQAEFYSSTYPVENYVHSILSKTKKILEIMRRFHFFERFLCCQRTKSALLSPKCQI